MAAGRWQHEALPRVIWKRHHTGHSSDCWTAAVWARCDSLPIMLLAHDVTQGARVLAWWPHRGSTHAYQTPLWRGVLISVRVHVTHARRPFAFGPWAMGLTRGGEGRQALAAPLPTLTRSVGAAASTRRAHSEVSRPPPGQTPVSGDPSRRAAPPARERCQRCPNASAHGVWALPAAARQRAPARRWDDGRRGRSRSRGPEVWMLACMVMWKWPMQRVRPHATSQCWSARRASG